MAALLVLYLSPLEKTKIIIIIIIVINNILAVTFSKIQLDINGHKQLVKTKLLIFYITFTHRGCCDT